ncbi:MAG: hypothetical protein ACP5RT_03130 [Candidatus Micrarchaeia archaeon]
MKISKTLIELFLDAVKKGNVDSVMEAVFKIVDNEIEKISTSYNLAEAKKMLDSSNVLHEVLRDMPAKAQTRDLKELEKMTDTLINISKEDMEKTRERIDSLYGELLASLKKIESDNTDCKECVVYANKYFMIALDHIRDKYGNIFDNLEVLKEYLGNRATSIQ